MLLFQRSAKPIFLSLLLLVPIGSASAKEWRGIVPLRSTRADVARLYQQLTGATLSGIGLPSDSFNVIGEGRVLIQYSLGSYVEGRKIRRDTVVSITIHLTNAISFADMKTELEQLPSDEDNTDARYYNNHKEGIYYCVQGGKVTSITYGPAKPRDAGTRGDGNTETRRPGKPQ